MYITYPINARKLTIEIPSEIFSSFVPVYVTSTEALLYSGIVIWMNPLSDSL